MTTKLNFDKVFYEAGTRVTLYVSADNHAEVLSAALKYDFGPEDGLLEDFARQPVESFGKGITVSFERRVSMEQAVIGVYKSLSKMLPLSKVTVTGISRDL